MDRVQWIYHLGRNILLVDFHDMQVSQLEEVRAILQHARRLIDTQPPKSLLVIIDVTNAGYNSESNKLMVEFAEKNTPFIKASAVVGAVGIRKVVIDTLRLLIRRDLKTCVTLDEAKDWLAKA